MKKVNLFVAVISCLMIGASPTLSSSPQKPTKQCINSLPDDSSSFGYSVVVNDKYLAVSDLGGNRVIIYQNDNSGKWVRSKEISPPKDSVPDKD